MRKFVLLIMFTVFLAGFVIAAEPALPDFLFGQAMVNGREVPVDSIIIATIGGEDRGSIKVRVPGYYGSSSTDQKLAVSGSRDDHDKPIEFYVHMPGIEGVKAQGTWNWKSGSVDEVPLIFSGTEVPLPAGQEYSNEASSSSAGGGGPIAMFPPGIKKESDSYVIDKISNGVQVDIPVYAKEMPITMVQLLLIDDADRVEFKFEDAGNLKQLQHVFKYLSIETSRLDNDKIKTAIIKFQVPVKWFEENDYDPEKTSMLRYHNENWYKLPTVYEGGDGDYHYYRAQTSGFSIFAIQSERNILEVEKVEVTGEIEDEESKGLGGITGAAVLGLGGGKAFWTLLVVYIVTIVGMAVYIFVSGKKKD